MDTNDELTVPAEARTPRTPHRIAIVGAGRMGTALTAALGAAGLDMEGPLGRDDAPSRTADAVLLCVPDAQIAHAAAALSTDTTCPVGHCSAATTLAPLAPHEAFSLHPLMTVTADGADFTGATAAIAGATERALHTAEVLALALGMHPVDLDDADRAAYHAAASIASNYLVTIAGLAERIARTAGLEREPFLALMRASVENWGALGAARALTGPILRGDEGTVARQRAAVAARVPEDLELFDALSEATRRLAATTDRGRAAMAREILGAPQGEPRGSDAHMQTVRTVAGLRAALREPRRNGRRIGLVPTMGALHEGHLSLVRQASEACDVVVVSLFVNPGQFNEAADLDAYPRDEARDAGLAAAAGADLLFAPPPDEVYPRGFATTVTVGDITEPLEGEHRGGAHFASVATVVAKLLNMVAPDVAYFGQKDAQQVAVIRRLVRDLDIPAAIEVGATVREPDGLALSSRNVRLTSADRERALALRRALDAVRATVAAGERDATAIAAAGRAAMADFSVEPEYLALVAPDTFAPVDSVGDERVLVAVAARVGDVRLIDNDILDGGF